MANVRALPVRHGSRAQLQRMTEQLRQAHEAGVDLGSRVPHIHGAAETFRKLAAELRLAVEALLGSRADSVHNEPGLAHILSFAAEAERLADLAAAFPDAGRQTTVA